jgi:carbon storage regulator
MLILSRKKEESIIIDDTIEITIVAIEEGKVKLGITAPKEISIHRKEIYTAIQKENRQAASGKLDLQEISSFFKKKE